MKLGKIGRRLVTLVIVCFSLSTNIGTQAANPTSAQSGNLSVEQAERIIQGITGQRFRDFADFTLGVFAVAEDFLTEEQIEAIGNFHLHRQLSASQRELLFRLLGIYTQLKYGGEAIRSLAKFVEVPINGANAGRKQLVDKVKFARLLKKEARKSGLEFRNIDNELFELSLPESGDPSSMIAFHATIKSTDLTIRWGMNGERLDPLVLTRVNDEIYGSGVTGGKGAAITAIYAMRVLVEENITLFNRVKLLVHLDQSVNSGVGDYFNQESLPDYNIVMDGHYPVSNAHAEHDFHTASYPAAAVEEGSWSNALLSIASETLNQEAANPEPCTHLAMALPHSLQYGLSLTSGYDQVASQVQHKSVDQFLMDMQIITEAMARLGQMKVLE